MPVIGVIKEPSNRGVANAVMHPDLVAIVEAAVAEVEVADVKGNTLP